MDIEFTERARKDLNEIFNYISLNSPQYAESFLKNYYEKIENLESFSKIGRQVPELENPNVREIIFKNYRIVYRILNERIQIITIIHGSRLLKY
jgi:addiction module RelE/StbE family toxin